MSTFHRKYELLKDTHKLKAGTVLKFHPFTMQFGDEYDTGHSKQLFSFDDMNDAEWFKPLGEEYELFPPAPEDMQEHFDSRPEPRHNDMCDFCRAYKKLANVDYLEGEIDKLIAETYNIWREPFAKEQEA